MNQPEHRPCESRPPTHSATPGHPGLPQRDGPDERPTTEAERVQGKVLGKTAAPRPPVPPSLANGNREGWPAARRH